MCVQNPVCVNVDVWSQGGALPAADPQRWQLWENAGQVDVNLTRKRPRLAQSGEDCWQCDLKPNKRKTISADKEALLWGAAK